MSNSRKVIEAIQNGQLNEVNDQLAEALREDSEMELYSLSDALYQLGFLDETRKVVHHLLKINPADDELRINLAEIEIEEGNDLEAIEILDNIHSTSEAYPQALLVAADYYQTNNLPEVSEQKLIEAQNILPEEPIILFALAEIHFSMGKYQQAIREYESLQEYGEDTVAGVELNSRIGIAYSSMGEFERATIYLEDSIENREDIDVSFQLALNYFQQKEYQRANEMFFKVRSLDQTYSSLYPYLAKGLEEEGDFDQAAEVVQQGLTQDETNEQLYLIAASIEIKQGNTGNADEYYQKAMQLNPENESIKLEYTSFLNYQERYEETVELIQYSLREQDVDFQFYWNLAIAQNELEEYEAAAKAFEKAYPYFDDNSDFLKQYILFLREDGQIDKMQKVAHQYLHLNPNDIEIQSLINFDE